ncbi:MAG TPA: hypothetical protein VF556_08505 [Pyrinomonadaceae bacterium]|jgi:hypothetical protein
MSGFYNIRVHDIFLSEDGTNTGLGCKLSVENVEDLLTTVAGNVQLSANGTPVFHLVEWTAGKQFAVRVSTLTTDVWLSLVELLNTALEENDTLSIAGAGDTGDFTVSAKPFPQKPFAAERFSNGYVHGITFRFITV